MRALMRWYVARRLRAINAGWERRSDLTDEQMVHRMRHRNYLERVLIAASSQ